MSTPPSLPEIFFQTTSPDPQFRRQAESYLCDTITKNPQCVIDILRFAADWGNHVQNSNNQNIVHSRLAAAIFVKNMIAHSSWGSGAIHRLTPQQIQEKMNIQNSNSNNNASAGATNNQPLSPSQMFGNFLPPPPLQAQIRSELIAAMVNWKNVNNANPNDPSATDPKAANVEDTILRYIESAVEAIHDVDWPRNWDGLFEQAVDDFTQNALPPCFTTLEKFSEITSSNNNNNNNNIMNNFFSNTEAQNLVVPFTNALNRASASLCVVKLCSKRMYDPESSDGILGNGIASAISKNRSKQNQAYKNEASEILLDLSRSLLQPLGERVLVPFVKIVSSPSWARLLIHCVDFASSNSNNESASALLQNFQRAWTTFCFEGLSAIHHLAQTQIYGALLDAFVGDSPFLFALVKGCTRLHHALMSRFLMHRESFFQNNNNNNNSKSNNNPEQQQQLLPENIFTRRDCKREAQVLKLWKSIWELLMHLYDHYGEKESVPKKIRSKHRDWLISEFVPVLSCALGMSVIHENRPSWNLSQFSSSNNNNNNSSSYDFSFSTLNMACQNPGEFSMNCIFLSFFQCCANEAASSSSDSNRLLLTPFSGAQFRGNTDAANLAVDLLELSVKFTPWVWWENILVSPQILFDKILIGGNYPSQIAPLFKASVDGFTQSTGALAWFLISWVILPRQAITCDEVEAWEINPVEYLNAKTDANTELFNLKSSYSHLLSALLIAREGNTHASGKNSKKKNRKSKNGGNKNNNNNDAAINIAKHRVQLLVDNIFQLLATASNELFNTNSGGKEFHFDVMNPHPAVLAADAALQIVRLCRHAVMERGNEGNNNSAYNNNNNEGGIVTPVESGLMMQGLLPLISAKNFRFGPLRAKAAQVVSELCAGIRWSGESGFQKMLTSVLDLMYDDDVAVRMQVCSSLSPLIRHPLAGTVVVPHLVRIVQQFFDVLAQNQNEIVIVTMRKLFAHYREHMAQWAVDLAKIILGRFEQVFNNIMALENEEEANGGGNNGHHNNNRPTEFHRAAGNSTSKNQDQEAFERELNDLTAIGDELLGAISTIVKCVPRPSTSSSKNNNNDMIRDTACALQDLLGPMIQNLFDSPHSMGFFEGAVKLLSVLLRRSELRVLPSTWSVFSSLFRSICVRTCTDYFSNMIAVLDNFVSADPASFMMQKQNFSNNQWISQHPGENETFAGQAALMLRSICENSHLPVQDVANAIQCIDCFVLNGARCLQNSLVARYAPEHTVVKTFTFKQICESVASNDPLHLRQFLEIPVILTVARQRRLPEQAGRMGLLATPSICVLVANSIFCCLLAADPRAVRSESVILQRSLLSFSLVSRLFDTFTGVGSGEYRKQSDLAEQPAHFRIYDRKLYILALSHFISSLIEGEDNSGDNNNNEQFFQMLQQEGYANALETMEGFLKTALMMVIENAYFDCRMLLALRGTDNDNNQNNEMFRNHNNDQMTNDDDDFFSEGDDDDDDDDTDVTTDDDFLEGVYADDDDEDEDEDEDGYVDDDNFNDDEDDENDHNNNNNNENDHGGVSKHSYVQKIAAAAAKLREEEEEDEDAEDDFNDNLLVEDPNQKITTPIDEIDEFRVLGEVLERAMMTNKSKNNNNNNSISNTVSSALQNLVQHVGGSIPVCRRKVNNNSKSNSKKRKNNNNNDAIAIMTFALAIYKNNNNNNQEPSPLPVPEFLRQCSRQRNAIDNFEGNDQQ